MAELGFLDVHLTYVLLRLPQTFEGRFYVKKNDGSFMDQSVFVLEDEEHKAPGFMFTLRNDVDAGLRQRNFRNFLAASAGVQDWPRYVDTIRLDATYIGIVTTGHFDTLGTLFERTPKFSFANGARLCYQLFSLLDTVHELGFVHRMVDMHSVRGGINWRGDFSFELNGFYYTTRMDPAPECYRMNWRYQSISVCNDEDYDRLDDFISALYLVITTQGVNMLEQNSPRALRAKEEFDENPRRKLRDDRLDWIADVYEELMLQKEEGIFDRHAIWVHLVTAVEGCDPSSQIDWHFASKESYDVIVDPNPPPVIRQARNPIRLANH